jgi:ankyrin repeat protein
MANCETIHEAVKEGNLVDVKRHVNNGADINAMEDKRGWTPLMLATLYGHLDIVKVLVEKGANVSAKGKDGRTPIMVAWSKDTVEFLKQHGATEQTIAS